MNRAAWGIGLEVASEFVPFTDIISDVVLLIAVWPRTEVVAPDDVDGCGERALWYLALSFTVVGTLVDLLPEMLLLSEIVLHPGVLTSPGSMRRLLRLIFSDGKPIVVFAAKEEHRKPLSEPMKVIKSNLRRRLPAVATGFFIHDDCSGKESSKWTYAGLIGILIGGEFLTAIGACLFLRIEFGWPALISLFGSLLALVISVRSHMMKVGEKTLHQCYEEQWTETNGGNGGRLLEFLLPGPVTLVRFLLAVPVWPMLLVYSESASFWPFTMADKGDHSLPWSEEAMWSNPRDWLRVAVPSLGVSDNRSPLSYLYWAIVPHLLFALVAAVVVGIVGITKLVCWYFGHVEDWSAHSWGVYFTSQASPFHVWSFRLQSALGMGFTMWVAQEFKRLLLFSLLLAIVTVQGYRSSGCMEQEWAFVFAVAAWWGIMLVGHAARRKNLFKPPPAAGGSATAVAGRGGGGGNGNDVGNGRRVAARV